MRLGFGLSGRKPVNCEELDSMVVGQWPSEMLISGGREM